MDCHFDDVFHGKLNMPEELKRKWGIQWGMQESERGDDYYQRKYLWRP